MLLYHGTSMNAWHRFIDEEGILPASGEAVVALTSSPNSAIIFAKRKSKDFIVLECEINPADILYKEGNNYFVYQVQRYKIRNWTKNPSLKQQDVEF